MAAKAKPDLGEFYRLSKRNQRKPCQIALALAQLEAGEQRQLQAASLDASGLISAGAISAWLLTRGHDASVPAITSHRQGKCACNVA